MSPTLLSVLLAKPLKCATKNVCFRCPVLLQRLAKKCSERTPISNATVHCTSTPKGIQQRNTAATAFLMGARRTPKWETYLRSSPVRGKSTSVVTFRPRPPNELYANRLIWMTRTAEDIALEYHHVSSRYEIESNVRKRGIKPSARNNSRR